MVELCAFAISKGSELIMGDFVNEAGCRKDLLRIFISFHHICLRTRFAPRRKPWADTARLSDQGRMISRRMSMHLSVSRPSLVCALSRRYCGGAVPHDGALISNVPVLS